MLITSEIAINTMATSVNYIWNSSFVLPSIYVSKSIIEIIESAEAIELAEVIEFLRAWLVKSRKCVCVYQNRWNCWNC